MAVDMSDILKVVKNNARTAKNVMESTGNANTKATIIKNAVNSVKSNMSNGQTKVINRVGQETVENVRRATRNAASDQINVRTASSAQRKIAIDNIVNNAKGKNINQTSSRSQQRSSINEAINKIKEQHPVDAINGNAKNKSVGINTVINNVKDSNINRTVDGRTSGRRNIINQAIDNVNNNRTAKNVMESNNSVANQMPINRQTFNTEPQASPAIRNNIIGDMEGTRTNTSQSGPKVEQPKFQGNTAQEGAVEPQFDFEGAQPDKVDPLDNQTRPTLGEGVDWKSMGGKAKEFFTGGFTDTYNAYKANGGDFTAAVKSAYQNEDGSLRMGRIAGSYMAAAAGARVLSGGGITKDRNGNNNLIGVPFI